MTPQKIVFFGCYILRVVFSSPLIPFPLPNKDQRHDMKGTQDEQEGGVEEDVKSTAGGESSQGENHEISSACAAVMWLFWDAFWVCRGSSGSHPAGIHCQLSTFPQEAPSALLQD